MLAFFDEVKWRECGFSSHLENTCLLGLCQYIRAALGMSNQAGGKGGGSEDLQQGALFHGGSRGFKKNWDNTPVTGEFLNAYTYSRSQQRWVNIGGTLALDLIKAVSEESGADGCLDIRDIPRFQRPLTWF